MGGASTACWCLSAFNTVGTGQGSHVTLVLVVQDEESISDALSYMLRKAGLEVAVCPTGPDALDAFDRSGPDLVLLDLMLPGPADTEGCRGLGHRSHVPATLFTAQHSQV